MGQPSVASPPLGGTHLFRDCCDDGPVSQTRPSTGWGRWNIWPGDVGPRLGVPEALGRQPWTGFSTLWGSYPHRQELPVGPTTPSSKLSPPVSVPVTTEALGTANGVAVVTLTGQGVSISLTHVLKTVVVRKLEVGPQRGEVSSSESAKAWIEASHLLGSC